MAKVGRPPWIPPDVKKVEQLASRGLTQQEIADALGIGLSTLYEKKVEFEEFAEAINRGKAKGIEEIANSLYESATKAKNVAAQIFYLKARAKWRDNDEIQINNTEETERRIRNAKDDNK